MAYIIGLILFAIFLIAVHELARKCVFLATLVNFICIISLFFVMRNIGWFMTAKLYSVLLPLFFFSLLRYMANTQYGEKIKSAQYIFWFFYLILQLNILEAIVRGAQSGAIINTLIGFVLCISMVTPKNKRWKLSKNTYGTYDFLVYFQPKIAWIILYTTWNLCFLLQAVGNQYVTMLVTLLMTPLYVLFVNRPELYFSARAYTLGLSLFIAVMGHDHLSYFYQETFMHLSSLVPLLNGLNIVLACYVSYRRLTLKKQQEVGIS